jgi:hypothetical protein
MTNSVPLLAQPVWVRWNVCAWICHAFCQICPHSFWKGGVMLAGCMPHVPGASVSRNVGEQNSTATQVASSGKGMSP